MVKLISNMPDTRWAVRNLSQIYGNVVWCSEDDVNLYQLIDADNKPIANPDFRVEKVEVPFL